MRIENRELICVTGGISSSLITSVVRLFSTVMDFGKMVGSTIRRGITKNYC
ncbi:MAG: hypothetical protein NC483_02600 [Ruminococcus sp.]|nr:hypothetical protein [Ruminococcus sp.]